MHYFQFHIGDYKSHTHHLSLLEDLAFRRLLDHYYLHEIPIKQREIARQIGMREHEQEVLTVLEEFFVSTEKGYINPRADDEIAKYRKFIEDGKRGAAKRWLKGDDSPPIATPIATNNHKPITINQEPKVKTQRGSRLPVDFVLPEDWIGFCQQYRKDLNPQEVFDGFKDFWISKPGAGGVKLDWTATWRNWVRSQSAPKTFANKYDVAHVTTPPPPNQDAALRKIEEDRKKAVPPSLETLAKLAELRKGVV
jgi:uncharacterized protein YdaU (DUF1376 family)